jgi:uncharacterized membrane protein YraQ (UPF0718 family)
MQAMAFVLSLCAEADAFIAASFRSEFAMGALLAFLVFGPMFDIKLLLMYRLIVRGWAVAVLAVLLTALTFVYAWSFSWVWP